MLLRRNIGSSLNKLLAAAGNVPEKTALVINIKIAQGEGVQTLYEAQLATLASGAYLLGAMAVNPAGIPVGDLSRMRRLSNETRRKLRSRDAERSVLFLAHALLRFSTRTPDKEAVTSFLPAFEDAYPLGEDDRTALDLCCGGFAELDDPNGLLQEPMFAVYDFTCRAASHALALMRLPTDGTITIWPSPPLDPMGMVRAAEVMTLWTPYVRQVRNLVASAGSA